MDLNLSPRQAALAGARATIPMIVGAMPFGILFGSLGVQAGLTPLATQAMSLIVFAGSAQFVAATLVGQGAAVWVIVMTTFIINLRHALYSASLSPYLRGVRQRFLSLLGFWLTDESYAAVIAPFRGSDNVEFRRWFQFGSGLAMYLNWQLCTLIGIVAGQRFVVLSDLGLEFAMVVTFIAIVVPMLKDWSSRSAALVSGGVSLLAHGLPNQSGLLLAALAGIGAGLLVERVYVDTRSGP